MGNNQRKIKDGPLVNSWIWLFSLYSNGVGIMKKNKKKKVKAMSFSEILAKVQYWVELNSKEKTAKN